MGRIIAFANQKGGVGKTSSCVNLAACLAEMGKRVLIVDADPQGNATTGLGYFKDGIKGSVYNVLSEEKDARSFVLPTCTDNLFLLPSSIDLVGAEVELVFRENYEKCLKSHLNPLKDEYDYVFEDCPPSLGILTLNALTAADGIIVPMQCEYYALESVGRLMYTVSIVKEKINVEPVLEGIILTMYDGRSLLCRQIEEEVRSHFGGTVFDTVIPRSVRISEAPGFGVPVTVHAPASRGAKAYGELAAEFLGRPQ